MTTKASLIKQAEAAHAQYPQYKGKWNSWVVGTMTRDIKSRGYLVLSKGEKVLVDSATLSHQIPHGPKAGKISPTVYAPNHYMSGGCNMALGGPFVTID